MPVGNTSLPLGNDNIASGDVFIAQFRNLPCSVQQAVDMINNEYNSPVRQTRVKNYLNSLRLGSFEAKVIETSAALSQIYKIITKFSRQAPRSHQGDAHKVEFLRNAVVGYPWSHEPLSRVPTHNLTFQMLYGELEAALQLYKEARLAMLRDKAESGNHPKKDDPSSIFYQGQGRYLKDASIFRRDRNNASVKKQKKQFNPLSIQGCFNCDSPDHMVKQCPRPLNVAKAATRKMDYYSKKEKGGTYAVHQVLGDPCVQLDGSSTSGGEETESCTDVEGFQTILGNANAAVTISEISEPEESSNAVTNIYVISCEHANVHEIDFLGACIDSAAQKTVVGKPQAQLYNQLCGIPFSLEPSNKQPSFRFGTHRHPGLGKIEIRVLISSNYFMPLKVDVVNSNIPFLLGLDTMTAYGMFFDTEGRTLSSKFDGWEVPLVRKRGHLYYEWDIQIFFTETELRKIHRHFFHPKAEKLYSLIRRADPDTTSPEVLKDLERIGSTCDPCQRLGTAPHRFKVSLPSGDIVFNREVCFDLMSLNQRAVIHAVDRDTKFNVARFLSDETAETTWDTFREMWISTYVGYPDVISADQGPQFRSKYWRSVTKLAGITLKPSGVESHNAINVGEKYREFLRRIFNKTKAEKPQLRDEDLLILGTKALKDTAGPNGLVPTLLVFGILPRIPFVPTELPTQTQRMIAMDAARAEMSKLVAESKLKIALKTNAPGAASSFEDIKIGSEVLVYREKPVNEWTGPFSVLDVDGKMCQLNVNGKQSGYSIDKVKLFRKPTHQAGHGSDLEPPNGDAPQQSTSDKMVDPTDGTLVHMERDSVRHPYREGTEIDRGHPLDDHEVINRWKDSLSDLQNEQIQKDIEDLQDLRLDDSLPDDLFADEAADVHFIKVLPPKDPRSESPEFDGAKIEEVEGIKKRDIWEIVHKDEAPSDANILGGHFVLAYKNHGTSNESVKARYVAQGHKDKEKDFVVHNVTTLRASSIRTLVSVAAVKGFRIYADDVRQAYLQNEHQLTRDIYLLPKPKDKIFFGLSDNQLLKLKKPLYGVPDAGDYWDLTIHDHVKEDLNLIPLTGDPAVYRKPNEEDLDGLMAVYVDDKAMTGNEDIAGADREDRKTLRIQAKRVG